jgi:hypothetical protein
MQVTHEPYDLIHRARLLPAPPPPASFWAPTCQSFWCRATCQQKFHNVLNGELA